jgi:hypothetical protein
VEKIFTQVPKPHQKYGDYFYKMFVECCLELAKEDERVILVVSNRGPWHAVWKEVKKEWLERLDDGEGCWGADTSMVVHMLEEHKRLLGPRQYHP